MLNLTEMGKNARAAFQKISLAPHDQRLAALHILHDGLLSATAEILAANEVDVRASQANGNAPAFIDRLTLNPKRLKGIANDLMTLIQAEDPLGKETDHRTLANGISLCRRTVPLGVMGVIYESRPNVTMDVAGLCIKTGNTAILRGGSDNLNSNLALMKVVRQALDQAGLPADTVQLIDNTDRKYIGELLKLHEYLDLIIPRGGANLHRLCRENSMIPVITGGIGVCHLFVDETADLSAAIPLIRNAKIQKPSACNALDTVLVHENVASEFLPALVNTLAQDGVSFRAEPLAMQALTDLTQASILPATQQDFSTEWLDLILGLKVVANLEDAIAHIQAHSTQHSDGILSDNHSNIEIFVNEVDSAAVFVNADTRFNDGAQFGLGAEVAVSTQRLHVRGPMGLPELTSYKWVVRGDYTIRQ
jgi:glutamate-5-semialdehyde dehydrogenase